MTSLEEIEQAIDEAKRFHPSDKFVAAIGPLYQARAIERLNLTVETLGIAFARFAASAVTFMEEKETEIPQPDIIEPHPWFNPIPGRKLCAICGSQRDHVRHVIQS